MAQFPIKKKKLYSWCICNVHLVHTLYTGTLWVHILIKCFSSNTKFWWFELRASVLTQRHTCSLTVKWKRLQATCIKIFAWLHGNWYSCRQGGKDLSHSICLRRTLSCLYSSTHTGYILFDSKSINTIA